jgi:K+ transporter
MSTLAGPPTVQQPTSHDLSSSHHPHPALPGLILGAIGVVFGDIGTSPLYAFREALGQTAADGIDPSEILGVLSLALWTLTLIVTIKYVLFLMRADNHGEGGVLALAALARRAIGVRSRIAIVLGAIGASLFYGDAIITPSLSVLSAMEGLRTIPSAAHIFDEGTIRALTIVILIALFFIQSRGTAMVATLFGPICVVWFVVIGGLGIWHIADELSIFRVLWPSYGIHFLATHGTVGLFVLGAVFLTVTGAEALTADMGHFGKRPIRLAWLFLVFPALMLNYLGQGAFALSKLEAAQAAGKTFTNQDWFYLMAPESVRGPLVVLAGLATVIASQAVITGAFSLTQQAVQLGLLPRMRLRQTSADFAGQIYLPAINWMLLAGVLVLILQFKTSSDMAAAYGIAVTGTMVVTTLLGYLVARHVWGWRRPLALAAILPFLLLDTIFFGANILRVIEGGWHRARVRGAAEHPPRRSRRGAGEAAARARAGHRRVPDRQSGSRTRRAAPQPQAQQGAARAQPGGQHPHRGPAGGRRRTPRQGRAARRQFRGGRADLWLHGEPGRAGGPGCRRTHRGAGAGRDEDELLHRPQHAEAGSGPGNAAMAGPRVHVPAAQRQRPDRIPAHPAGQGAGAGRAGDGLVRDPARLDLRGTGPHPFHRFRRQAPSLSRREGEQPAKGEGAPLTPRRS